MVKVSIFKDVRAITKPHLKSVTYVLNRIRSGASREAIEQIRATDVKKERTDLKKFLPSVIFAGEATKGVQKVWASGSKQGEDYVSYRDDKSIERHSGLFVLDFDDLEAVQKKKDELKKDEYIYAAWISPSGNGLKALVRIPAEIENHPKYYDAFIERYPELDTTSRNLSRLSFESYDPDIYVNESSKIWDKILVEQKDKPAKLSVVRKKIVTDWTRVNLVLRKIQDAHDGEKHDVLCKISYLFGGWVSGNEIDRVTAEDLLRREIENKDGVDDLESAYKAITDGLNAGELNPLSEFNQRETMNMKVGVDKMYIHLDEVKKEVTDFYKNGYPRGAEAGWDTAKEFISFLKGSTTYVYGPPYSGKSQVMHEIYVNLAIHEGWKIAMMTPETGTVEQVYGELISIYIGKAFIGDFQMTEEEMTKAMEFIRSHFFIIEPAGRQVTMQDFFTQVEGIEREFQVKIDLASIDPINYLKFDTHETNGREDIAIGFALDYMLHDAKSNNRHNVIITHVRDQQVRTTDEKQMYFPLASPRDVSSGQIFYRKGMQMISVYRPLDIKGRPLLDDDGIPYFTNETHIHNQKAKPKGTGSVGMFRLFYDYKRNQYYEKIGSTHSYADKFKVALESAKSALQPNQDFIQKEAPF